MTTSASPVTVVAVGIVVGFFLVLGGQAYQWSSKFQGEQFVYSCVGKRVDFPWEFTLGKGERIIVISWTFDGYFTSQQVATYTRDFNPYPSYSSRLTQVGNAGISLDEVTKTDDGNYTVEISGIDGSGNYFTLHRTVILQIIDSPLPKGQELKVTQLPQAVKVKDTGKWSVALACGKFVHNSLPPFPVYWTTPSSVVIKESSDYQDDQYILLLPNPVKGGNYTCQVPPLFAEDACLDGHSRDKAAASVVVDGLQARVSLLESHQEELLRQNEELLRQNEELASAVRELNSTSVEGDVLAKLSHRMASVENTTSELTGLMSQTVSFHVRLDTDKSNLPRGSVLVLTQVVHNHGNAYSPDTGKFTAPYNGTYWFMGSTVDTSSDKWAYLSLVVDDKEVDYLETSRSLTYQAASVQAVLNSWK